MDDWLDDYRVQLVEKKKIVLKIKVIPKAPSCAFKGVMADGTIKLAIDRAAEKGKANAAVCSFLAKAFDVSKENVRILSGQTARSKLVEIIKE